MVGIGLRDFECSLCDKTFERMSGDLMVPGPEICEDCLQVVWDMDEAAKTQYVTDRLVERQREEIIQKILEIIQWNKERYTSVDAVIKNRKNPFQY